MGRRLGRTFFARPTLKVAKDLLGCYLVRKRGRRLIKVLITETEAYIGAQDKANHASRGRTARTEVMFGEPGHLYVYMIYGMHYCLNVVTEKVSYPAAVLIRAVTIPPRKGHSFFSPYEQKKIRSELSISGPGRVCKYLNVGKTLNELDIVRSREMWFESGNPMKDERILAGKRIGVAYAGKWQHKLWRFYIKKSKLSHRTIN